MTAQPSFTLSATAASATAVSPGTSTVTVTPTNGFHSVVEFSASNWPAGITATFGTNPTTASSTVTISVDASVAPGPYALTLNGSLGTLSASTTIPLTVTALQGLGSSAVFTGLDASTQGNWSPKYGSDGYLIADGANNVPGYASVAVTGALTFLWAGSTPDVRALQSSPGSSSRIASCYCTLYSNNFNVSLNLTDGATHQIAIYLVDWDTTLRSQTITIADSASGILLDSRTFTQFSNCLLYTSELLVECDGGDCDHRSDGIIDGDGDAELWIQLRCDAGDVELAFGNYGDVRNQSGDGLFAGDNQCWPGCRARPLSADREREQRGAERERDTRPDCERAGSSNDNDSYGLGQRATGGDQHHPYRDDRAFGRGRRRHVLRWRGHAGHGHALRWLSLIHI